MCLGKISKIRKNSFLDFLSPLKLYLKKTKTLKEEFL